jgi:thioredoxin reductase (NADPH)
MSSELREFKGDNVLNSVTVENLKTSKISEIKVDGVFIFIGYQPNTEFLKNIVELNDRDEIIVDTNMKTNIRGVFAGGDCIAKKYRQVTTAVAEGTVAALSAAEYLRE